MLPRLRDEPDDSGAWTEFVTIYGRPVVQWCRSHGLQHDDAHDVAQDVLVRFWRHAAVFRHDPARRFRGYLRQMVVAAVSDWSAARRADRLGTGAATLQDFLATVPARDSLVRRIEEAFDMEVLDLALDDVKRRVQPRTWQAFHLLAIERVPAADVAGRLGMTVDNAYRARSYVLRLLRRAVARRERSAADSVHQPS
ncbi:MAG: sigma-70 family RNA polymerase sigma factor [Planctomycetes bacterium]|nr:sigma-70 family RNA polymerase sigma factor [Planctomycetota bacterium]